MPAQHPLQHTSLYNDNSVGFGLNFAKEYLKTCSSQDELYLVCCAMGGTGFTPVDFGYGPACWKKNFKGTYELYNMMINDVKNLLNQDKELKVKGLLWHQGESDIGNWQYHHDLSNFVKNVREDLGNANLPFVCGTMLKSFKDMNPMTSMVDNVHKGVPQYMWLAECAIFDDLMGKADFVHFDAESEREMGKRYCQKVLVVEDKYEKALEEWKRKNS